MAQPIPARPPNFRMLAWVLAILAVIALAAIVALVFRARAAQDQAAAERRRRFTISDTGERIPLAQERPPEVAPSIPELDPSTINPPHAEPTRAPAEPGIQGRMVHTPDGEMILTNPPFALRDAMFSHKSGRFINALSRRVPAWIMLCPRVRLDSLLIPTKPDGRDPKDWRDWRRRVRVRSIDLVLCDRRTWRPLVAVLFEQSRPLDARRVAGGQDRMIDEVLSTVGLPLLRMTGQFERDWAMIRPYVEESILPHMTDEQVLEASTRTARVDPDSAVTLLRMDEDKGWILE